MSPFIGIAEAKRWAYKATSLCTVCVLVKYGRIVYRMAIYEGTPGRLKWCHAAEPIR